MEISMSWIIYMSASVIWSFSKLGSIGSTILSTAEVVSTSEVFKYPLTDQNATFLQFFFKFHHIYTGHLIGCGKKTEN